MLPRSNLYNSIFATTNHSVEWKITINGTDYGMDKIAADVGGGIGLPHIHRQIFPESSPSVGGCVAATFECSIFEASANVPRMATVVPKYRLVTESQQSEWISLGTFYIDTRSVDEASGLLTLSCYDRMLVADQTYADVTGFATWPQTMAAVVSEICTIIGVTLDARTSIRTGTGYTVDYPNDLTMREVLGYIAVAHAGNWTVTPENKLRLIPLTGGTDTLNLGTNTAALSTSPAFAAWSKVTVYWADEEAFQAGTDTGRELVCDCPWATQETANGILSIISGTTYQPFSGSGSFIDLALELGDKVTAGYPGETITAPVWTIDITAQVLEVAQISAEGEQEIDHEYPYHDYVDRTLQRKVTLGQSYYGTSISREKGLYIARSDGKSNVTLNSDQMVFRGLVDGAMIDQIYFDPTTGRYIFNGSLGADAVFTDSLYAETGDIAELTVDRLSTSRRIRKYILQDTSDDNYILIQDQYLRFITGTPSALSVLLTESWLPLLTEGGEQLLVTSDTYATVQARNRYGELLYWQREPVSHTTAGYPLDEDGVQIYASTTATEWPVQMYSYTEQVKAEFAFNLENGVYVPQIVLGAGDENGRTIGRIHKSPDGMDWIFTTSAGEEIGLKAWSSGFMDIYGLRKTTEMDFSAWDSGSFVEKLDGNKQAMYFVTFDSQSRPVKITDGSGHETAVIW